MPTPKRFIYRPKLKRWYSSTDAKLRFGEIVRLVYAEGETIGLLGSEEQPYLYLSDADLHASSVDEHALTIADARADWANLMDAACHYGARFRFSINSCDHAVLFANPDSRHPARRYGRNTNQRESSIAEKLDEILDEIRRIKTTGSVSSLLEDLDSVTARLEDSSNLIDRRWREIWRNSNGNGPTVN